MEALVQMFGGAATLIAVLGGAMATIFFAWAGIQWMMASGDPQKIGQARDGIDRRGDRSRYCGSGFHRAGGDFREDH